MYVIFFWLVVKEGLLVALDISEIAITEKASQKKSNIKRLTQPPILVFLWYTDTVKFYEAKCSNFTFAKFQYSKSVQMFSLFVIVIIFFRALLSLCMLDHLQTLLMEIHPFLLTELLWSWLDQMDLFVSNYIVLEMFIWVPTPVMWSLLDEIVQKKNLYV